MEKRSVGLLILSEVEKMGLVAFLRERGVFNFEKMQPESWPGACQITVHGKLEEGETFEDALYRELTQELGPDFADIIWRQYFASFVSLKTEKENIETLALKIDFSLLSQIRLAPDSGCLRLVRKSDISSITDIANYPRDTGVKYRGVIAMFPDEKEALALAFRHFAPNSR